MRTALVFLASFAVVGCDGAADVSAPPASEQQATLEQQAAPADDALAKVEIPERFRGVWDYEGGTCDPASDLRTQISGDQIRFYESTGEVVSVELDGDKAIVELAMTGEGESWTQTSALIPSAGSDTLIFQADASAVNPDVTNNRKRCP